MRLTRKEILAGAAAGALGAAGIYELVDRLSAAPPRGNAARLPAEQHVLEGLELIEDNGVEVVVPPRHHQVVTARLTVGEDAASLSDARAELERALKSLESEFQPPPAGLGVTVAWGLPYFRKYVPGLAERHLPVDRRASERKGHRRAVLLDSIRFPSDPDGVILEQNDLAVLLRSDAAESVAAGAESLFGACRDVLAPTSVRKGFVGGGFGGGPSLPKQMALAAGIAGADLIPEGSQLFLGFTSTQRAGLGPGRIANFETLGLADLGRSSYFRGGTSMHLSHIFEDLEAWYLNFNFTERVATAFRQKLDVPPGTQTVPQAGKDAASRDELSRDFRVHGSFGHSEAIQLASRLQEDVSADDGTLYPKGTAIPQRADFNTLDNPFFWSVDPGRDGLASEPAAGVHFVVFNPTSDDFHRNRLAMDGVLPDGTKLELPPRSRGQGFNAVLKTTHRQNFLVPPRRNRAFPLADLV